MTLPPDPFNGRISQDQLSAWFATLEFPAVDPDQPIRHRNVKVLGSTILAALGLDPELPYHVLHLEWHGGGAAIAADEQLDAFIPFPVQLTQWVIMADQSCTASVDIWAATFDGDVPPVVGDSITGATQPTVTAAQGSSGTVFADWTGTGAIAASTWLRFNLDANDAAERLTLVLVMQETP